jgi:hypothetical protein
VSVPIRRRSLTKGVMRYGKSVVGSLNIDSIIMELADDGDLYQRISKVAGQ